MKLGFVGLGVMGGPMAGHLVRSGRDVTVWNRTPEKAAPLLDAGASIAASLEDLGAESDIVFLCVSRSEDVIDCIGQLSRRSRPGALFVDHSTILPEAAKIIHSHLAEKNLRFVDAPITGGSMGAQKGQLTIFCGGAETDINEMLPVIAAYAKRAERVGGPGAGQMMKMANQIAVGGALLALCESLSFAEKAGLDMAQTRELLSGGAAGSWAMENYGPKILARDWTPGFKIKDQLKDFKYCLQTAEELNAALPGATLVDELLTQTAQDGFSEMTTAALFETLRKSGFKT